MSRRRLTDDVGFDPDAVRHPNSAPPCFKHSHVQLGWRHSSNLLQVDEEGLPLVYNEAKITEFWRDRCDLMPALTVRVLCALAGCWTSCVAGLALQVGRAGLQMDNLCGYNNSVAHTSCDSCAERPPRAGASAAGQGCSEEL